MDLFEILKKIYQEKDIKWLNRLDQSDEIQPFILNKWLSMDNNLQKEVKYLDKFTFNLEPKQFIMLAWAIIPKQSFRYNKYIKKNEDVEDEYIFLIEKIRKNLEISDNDWNAVKKYYLEDIEHNKVQYFKSFGVDKKTWKKFGLDYNKIKKSDNIVETIPEKIGINKWF